MSKNKKLIVTRRWETSIKIVVTIFFAALIMTLGLLFRDLLIEVTGKINLLSFYGVSNVVFSILIISIVIVILSLIGVKFKMNKV